MNPSTLPSVPSGQSEMFSVPSLSERPVDKDVDPKGTQRLPLPPAAQLLISFADEILVLGAFALNST